MMLSENAFVWTKFWGQDFRLLTEISGSKIITPALVFNLI